MSSKADPVSDTDRLVRVVGDSMTVITDALGLLEPTHREGFIASCRDMLDAAEATLVSGGSSDRQVETLLSADRSSERMAETRARRGRADLDRATGGVGGRCHTPSLGLWS